MQHIINLRKDFNKTKINFYVSRFLKLGLSNTRYIYIQLELANKESVTMAVGDNYILDVKNSKEVANYKFYLNQYLVEPKYTEFNPTKVIFKYRKVNKKDYQTKINSFRNNEL